jgi:hypothetical protein
MKKYKVFQRNICLDCLQLLVNGESDHSEEELTQFNHTLELWAKTGYIPAGLSDNSEPFFSHNNCDICNQMPGNRYEYNFFQTK